VSCPKKLLKNSRKNLRNVLVDVYRNRKKVVGRTLAPNGFSGSDG
jgi:hypothetical protein